MFWMILPANLYSLQNINSFSPVLFDVKDTTSNQSPWLAWDDHYLSVDIILVKNNELW